MEPSQNVTHRDGSAGGPKTQAGKDRSKLNALTHGFYAKGTTHRSGPQRKRIRLYRKIHRLLVKQLNPPDIVAMQWIDDAADARLRKASILGWEEARIEAEMKKPLQALKEIVQEIAEQRQAAQDLQEELARLEAEKESGLLWEECSLARLSFLEGVVLKQAGGDVAETFQRFTSGEERRTFFLEVVGWDETALWKHLVAITKRTMDGHMTRAEELTGELERLRRSDGLDPKEVALLSKEDMEFVLTSVSHCNRQFNRAIESFMRYRLERVELATKEQSLSRRLEKSRAQLLQEN